MKSKTIKVWLILFALLLVVLTALIASPSLRFTVFRMLTELPAIATHFTIQKYVKDHDFTASAAGLDRQLSVVKLAGTSRNSMVRGLIRNTEMAMGVAELSRDYAAMTPFLERFVEYQPNLYIARIWLAQALSHSAPAKAFIHLEKAARIVPADDRTYHIAVRAAVASGDFDKARDWCGRYRTAKFGGLRPLIYRNIFAGTGLRKMALEIPRSEGVPVRIFNEGVVMGQSMSYSFDLHERTTADFLRLHLGLLPGVKVAFEGMTLFGPAGIQRLTAQELIILPEESFIIANGTLMTVSPDGEKVTLRKRKGAFGPADRIDLRLNFKRAGLATLPGCEGL